MSRDLARTSQLTGIAANAVFVVVTIAILAAWYLREDNGGVKRPGERPPVSVRQVENWRDYVGGGNKLGNPSAKVTVLEFADFQCPACRFFALEFMPSLYKRYGSVVAVEYRHFPLRQNTGAVEAANAAECAGEQGQFKSFHDELFSNQEVIGLRPLTRLAQEAGVSDLQAFEGCLQRAALHPHVERDIQIGKRLRLEGTPSLLVNGVLLFGVPDTTQLFRIIDDALGTR